MRTVTVSTVLTVLTTTVLTLTSCGSSPTPGTTVGALWVGVTVDGENVSGVSEVTVNTSLTPDGGVRVDDEDTLTGPVWRATSMMGAAMGVLGSGVPLTDGVEVKFRGGDDLDGPSAGGLLTTAVLADLASVLLDGSVTMTGTVAPSGAVGPVAGIPGKVRAAAEAGYRTVLIPVGQRFDVDPGTGAKVDVVALGEQLGVQVREVASVREAYGWFTGQKLPVVPQVDARVNDQVAGYLDGEAVEAVALMNATVDRLGVGVPSFISSDVAAVRAEFDSGLRWQVVTPALLVAREATVYATSTQSRLLSSLQQLRGDTTKVLQQCQRWREQPLPVQHMEQVTAFASVTSHITSMCVTATDIDSWVNGGGTPTSGELVAAREETTSALFMFTHVIPVAWQVASLTGNMPLTSTNVASFTRYTQLLDDAADANRTYLVTQQSNGLPQDPWFTRRANQTVTTTQPVEGPLKWCGGLGKGFPGSLRQEWLLLMNLLSVFTLIWVLKVGGE